jgi:hypothetical protein
MPIIPYKQIVTNMVEKGNFEFVFHRLTVSLLTQEYDLVLSVVL